MLKYGDLFHFESVQGGNSFSTAKVTLQGDSEKEDTKLKGKKNIEEVVCCEQFHVTHLTLGSNSS